MAIFLSENQKVKNISSVSSSGVENDGLPKLGFDSAQLDIGANNWQCDR